MNSLDRLWQSMAWRLFPRADLTMNVGEGCVLSLKNRGDFVILREIFIDQVYAPYLQAIGPLSSWVDLGCNCGMFSLYAERAAKSAKGENWPLPRRALLVDASPVALAAAEDALRQSQTQTEFRCVYSAVAGHAEFVDFYEGKTTHKSSLHHFGSRAKKRRVPVINLEKACAGFIDQPDLIKIDIEGAEAALLDDWKVWIQSARHLIVEWHEPHMSGVHLNEKLHNLGFVHRPLAGQGADETLLKGETGTGLWSRGS